MRTEYLTVGWVTYPDEVVYSKDANFFVVETYSIQDVRCDITVTDSTGRVVRLSNSFYTSFMYVDISYALMGMREGDITVNVVVDVGFGGRDSFETSFKLFSGYSLPNRMHYDDNTAYIPPEEIFNKAHPDNDGLPYIEFGSPVPIVIGGKYYDTGDIFRVYSDSCDVMNDVVVPYNYDNWETEETYKGISHMIVSRFVTNADLLDYFIDEGYIEPGVTPLEHGIPDLSNQCIASAKLIFVNKKVWKVDTLQFPVGLPSGLEKEPVQFHPDNLYFEFNDSILDENLTTGTVYRTYHFNVTNFDGGSYYGEGDVIFQPYSPNISWTTHPYESISFLLGEYRDDMDVPNYDYSAVSDNNIKGCLKMLHYGIHYSNSSTGPFLEDKSLLWRPDGGTDGYYCIKTSNNELLFQLTRIPIDGCPIIDLFNWFSGTTTSNYRRYDLETRHYVGKKTYNFKTKTRRFNVATTQENHGVNNINLKNFRLIREDGVNIDFYPQSVSAVINENGDLVIHKYRLSKYDVLYGGKIDVDYDGNQIWPEMYVKIICHGDFINSGGGDCISGTAEVYDMSGNLLDANALFEQNYCPFMKYGIVFDGTIEYCFLPFTCETPVLRTDSINDIYLQRRVWKLSDSQIEEPYLFGYEYYDTDFDLGRSVIRNGNRVIPQPHYPLCVYPIIENPPIEVDGTVPVDLPEFYDLVEQSRLFAYGDMNGGNNMFVISHPCERNDNQNYYSEMGASENRYTLVVRGSCLDRLVWIRYTNHDGLERWMPARVLSNKYKTTGFVGGKYRPDSSTINAFGYKSVSTIEERIDVVSTDVPNTAHIEDMFMSDNVEIFNEDGTMFFTALIEDEGVDIDFSKEENDYRFTILKKV